MCVAKWQIYYLGIPVSNADSERGFSMLRKIHTDQWPSLRQETLNLTGERTAMSPLSLNISSKSARKLLYLAKTRVYHQITKLLLI